MQHPRTRRVIPAYSLYLDDSGTRHPTHRPGKMAKHKHDWFALGGILVRDEDEPLARELHAAFLARWPQIAAPLHSSEIRSQNENFRVASTARQARTRSLLRRALLPDARCSCDRHRLRGGPAGLQVTIPGEIRAASLDVVQDRLQHCGGTVCQVRPLRWQKIEGVPGALQQTRRHHDQGVLPRPSGKWLPVRRGYLGQIWAIDAG